MPQAGTVDLARIVAEHEPELLTAWTGHLKGMGILRSGRLLEAELQTQCRTVLRLLGEGMRGGLDPDDPAYGGVRDTLGEISRSRAMQGFTPSETAGFVLSLKEAIFPALDKVVAGDPAVVVRAVQDVSRLVDRLGLYTTEVFQRSREEVIIRQQQEISELSTPVVKLWDGILALPLIGTLDSQRTQVIMENLLQSLVDHGAEIAIIDITGVPTVDTLVAQHLLKTVAAARLMGADCLISGIRPQIAQTMVHLGVELNVTTKASLADAFALALRRIGRSVVPVRPQREATPA